MAVETAASRTVSISGERFATLWRETSMSQETFAAAIGMKRSGVFRLLRPGKHGMFTDNFRRLAEVLKTSPDELRSRIGSDAIELSALNMAERSEEFSSGVSGQAQPIREVTQFNGISAGARAERTDLQRGKVKVPRDFGDFFVRVDGESMTPEYPNDSVAIFEMVDGQTFIFGKEYLIWFTNGECYFSSVYESNDDRDVIVLRKLHADRERFPDRQIHRREIDRIAAVHRSAHSQEIKLLTKVKTMSRLIEWLDHRRDVVGFETWKDLSEFSGLSLHTLDEVQLEASVAFLNRSDRRALAGALRVSLRRLEQLDEGTIDWIEDDYFYDASSRGRPLPRYDEDPAYWIPKQTKAEDRGTPLIGRIREGGKAEPDEDWQEEWGRRIPKRFGSGHDIYALELDASGQSIVLRNIPVWEFREGIAAVYSWNGWEAEGWFGRVHLAPSKARVVTADGTRHDLDLLSVVRIGKVVGRWPQAVVEVD